MAEGGAVVRRFGNLNLEEQLSKFPAHLLDHPCAESHLGKLVHCLTTDTLEMMAGDLGLSNVEVEDIRDAWPRKPLKQRLEMFKTWQQKNESQATYRWVYGCILMKSASINSAMELLGSNL